MYILPFVAKLRWFAVFFPYHIGQKLVKKIHFGIFIYSRLGIIDT